LTRRINTGYFQTVPVLIAIIAVLSWGVFAVTWTSPNDAGSTLNAVFNGERQTLTTLGLSGNGTIIRPHSEAQFIMFYRTEIPAGLGSGTYPVPGGQGIAYGPLLWTAPTSNLTSFEVKYAVISFSAASTLTGPGPIWWVSGPQGNLTASLSTSRFGGLEYTRTNYYYQSSIFELSGPGNYTLHYLNQGSTNATAIVALGSSSVLFTHPYLYSGVTTIVIVAALLILTGLAFRVGPRKTATVPKADGATV
jgi:hypothetical protein